MIPRSLGLIISYKCTASCEMCCNESGPSRNEEMSTKDAITYIDQAKNTDIKEIGITGGEPFLYFKKIRDIAEYCRKNSIFFSCLTNAFWATSPSKASRMIKMTKDAGLCHLAVSTSDYHQHFVPLKNIRNCLESAVENDLSVELRVLVEKGSRKLQEYKELLGLKDSKIYYEEIPISKVGRGSALNIIPFMTNEVKSPCSSIFSNPVVEPNGNLYICCGVGYKNEKLCVGNLKTSGLSNLLKKAQNNLLYNIISLFGPDTISNIVAEDWGSSQTEQYTGICHLCSSLISTENFSKVTASIRKRKKELIIATKILKTVKEIETDKTYPLMQSANCTN